jgi:hypothetical protein
MGHETFSGFQPCDEVEVVRPRGETAEVEFISPRGDGFATVVDRDDDTQFVVRPEEIVRNITAEEEERAENPASRYGGPA